MTAVTITRRQARAADACVDDTRRVLQHIRAREGRLPGLDDPISLSDVADVLGIYGVIWCLDAIGGHDGLLQMFACRCARRALRRAGVRDPRSWRAVRVAWWYAHGWATDKDLSAAWCAAGVAEGLAAMVSGGAARNAARNAAMGAARNAAWDAAWDAARGADGAAERLHQKVLILTMAGYREQVAA